MGLFSWGLFGRHEVDAWRDDWTLVAATTLNEVATDLVAWSDAQIRTATRREVFLAPGSFVATRIAPEVHRRAEPAVDKVMAEANAALRRIVEHQAVWSRQAGDTVAAASSFEGLADVTMAAAPLAGSAAVAAAIPMLAVTTTTAWFGLVAATTVSWPVVAVGGALAATGLATGLINTARMRDKFEARLRIKARAHVVAALIRGKPKQPAVLGQLTYALGVAAEEAKELR